MLSGNDAFRNLILMPSSAANLQSTSSHSMFVLVQAAGILLLVEQTTALKIFEMQL